MLKQQSLYHPAGGYHVIYLTGNKRARAGHKYTSAFTLTGLPGMPAFLCFTLFLAALFTGSSTAPKSTMVHEKEVRGAPATIGSIKQKAPFSFEYSGLFHLKVVIHLASDNDAFLLSAIDITTSTQPSSDHSFKNCNSTYVSGKR